VFTLKNKGRLFPKNQKILDFDKEFPIPYWKEMNSFQTYHFWIFVKTYCEAFKEIVCNSFREDKEIQKEDISSSVKFSHLSNNKGVLNKKNITQKNQKKYFVENQRS